MGSCISKCSPKKHLPEDQFEFNHVQDKLVISQAQPPPPPSRLTTPPISNSNKILPSPPSPSHSSASSASSASSFTCTNYTSASTTTASSLSSSASSVSSAKIDRSFSNEFLWSCYKENPHVARISSIKEASFSLKALPQKPILPAIVNKKQPNVKRATGPITPQKRVRSSSPVSSLARQKSFRREPEKPVISAYLTSSRTTLRSPSPSRRFNLPNQQKESTQLKFVHSRHNNGLNVRPNYSNSTRQRLKSTRETETRIHRISSKIDEVAVGEALADYMDTLPEEDIDNPLISLDCFIFV